MMTVASTGSQRLYLADDHILVISPGPYSEESYRIALADVQALSTVRTYSWLVVNVLMIGLGAIYPVSMIVFRENFYDTEWFGIATLGLFFSAPFFIFLLANLIGGPTCTTILRTAVKQHDLTCLRRVRAAKKAIAMISEAVLTQQGSFAPQPQDHPEAATPAEAAAHTGAEISSLE